MPLHSTSLRFAFCLGHFAPPSIIFASLNSHHFTSHFVLLTSCHFMPLYFDSHSFLHHFTSLRAILLCLTWLFPASLHATSFYLMFCPPYFTPLHATLLCLPFCLPHFMPLRATSHHLPLFLPHFTFLHTTSHLICLPHFTPLHVTSLQLQFFLPHFMPLPFTSPPSFLPHFASPHLISSVRIGESFENLSHLQKIRTFKRFNSNFFPNLSNVLNILLTSLFLQKIQIFERFNYGESLK